MKHRGKVYPKLGLTMLKYFLFALLGAGIITLALGGLAFITMNEVSMEESQRETLARYVAGFQDFVTEQKVYSTDEGSIREWNKKNFLLDFILHDETVLYSTEDKEGLRRGAPFDAQAEDGRFPDFTVEFQDKACTLSVVKYYHLPFQAVWGILLYVVPFISFVAVFGILLQNKIHYIHALEEGIRIIEGGGLNYRIPIKGKDELTSLAESINAMSEAMAERVEEDDREKKQEFDLVASISHDIRTPLTTAICYLDFLHDGKFQTEEERALYVEKAREKVYHIKFLSDNLFEHSASEAEALSLHLEPLDGRELIGQLLSEFQFLLEDKGFSVQTRLALDTPFQLYTDGNQLRRVFDNMASNIIKYACAGESVEITARLQDNWFLLRQKNGVRSAVSSGDSFGIGMKNSARIIKAHHGSLEAQTVSGQYRLTLRLPAVAKP